MGRAKRAYRRNRAKSPTSPGSEEQKMNEQGRNSKLMVPNKTPAERFAYYRRCQVFRRNGEQCKAPSEKGSYICHAHAGQLAMAVRRERERRAVLTEAVAEMHRKGRREFEMADLFMDFKGIQVTLGKMAQALIDGRIDCKTAGRLVVQLQMASKALWVYHKGHREAQRTTRALTTKDTKGHKELPQICADGRGLSRRKALTTKNTKRHEDERQVICEANHLSTNQNKKPRIGLILGLVAFADIRGLAHGPPRSARAA